MLEIFWCEEDAIAPEVEACPDTVEELVGVAEHEVVWLDFHVYAIVVFRLRGAFGAEDNDVGLGVDSHITEGVWAVDDHDAAVGVFYDVAGVLLNVLEIENCLFHCPSI